jgi:hypothetical protein
MGSTAEARTFGGRFCPGGDCSGYAAGYRWAEARDIEDATSCPARRGAAFFQGCLVYVENPDRGADEDDNGVDIDD